LGVAGCRLWLAWLAQTLVLVKARWSSLQIVCVVVVAAFSVRGQDTLVFDQQSSTDETFVGGGALIQDFNPFGQSFTPTLSEVGFVRLSLYDVNPINGLGAALALNLRADSINGSVLTTTSTVSMPNGWTGFVNSFFPTNVLVTSGATYAFDFIVQPGSDSWRATVSEYNYPGGTVFFSGSPGGGMTDMWFREGIVVPEPRTWGLLLIGVGLLLFRKRQFTRKTSTSSAERLYGTSSR